MKLAIYDDITNFSFHFCSERERESSNMSIHKPGRRSSDGTRPSSISVYKELVVPQNAVGLVIGKGGSTIKGFQQYPGISWVKCSSGKVQIFGNSKEAVQRVASSIERLVAGYGVDKGYYFPDLSVICLCKSLDNPLLAVNKIWFEKIPSGPAKTLYELEEDHKPEMKSYFCFKSGEASASIDESSRVSCTDTLSAEFCEKITTRETFVCSHWDFSAYKSKLMPCLEPLLVSEQQQKTIRTIKLIVRFGKVLFYGDNCSELRHNGFMSLPSLQESSNRRCLRWRFSLACPEAAVKRSLENLEYVRVPSGMKISVHVADVESDLKRNVSIRCNGDQYGALFQNTEIARIASARNYFEVLGVDSDGRISEAEVRKGYRRCTNGIQPDVVGRVASEAAIGIVKEAYECLLDPAKRHQYLTNNVGQPSDGKPLCPSLADICREDERAEITRVRNQPKRHVFVTFLTEGWAATDFRLGISSHGKEPIIGTEMGKWIENAWENRTPDQLLAFEPTQRFKVMNVRYKLTETYMTEAWKFRISRVWGEDGRSNAKWEYALSSRWFKQKCGDGMTVRDMDSIMDNVSALVTEAVKFSAAMVA